MRLKKDEYFIADLIDIPVYEENGERLGVLSDVMTTGANDVYVVKRDNGGRDLLIPAIRQCILSVDVEEPKMVVRLLEGLEDL